MDAVFREMLLSMLCTTLINAWFPSPCRHVDLPHASRGPGKAFKWHTIQWVLRSAEVIGIIGACRTAETTNSVEVTRTGNVMLHLLHPKEVYFLGCGPSFKGGCSLLTDGCPQ
eukprot:3668541-Amphidinium_carterae.1